MPTDEAYCIACDWRGPWGHIHACPFGGNGRLRNETRERRERYALAVAQAVLDWEGVDAKEAAGLAVAFADELMRLLDEPKGRNDG